MTPAPFPCRTAVRRSDELAHRSHLVPGAPGAEIVLDVERGARVRQGSPSRPERRRPRRAACRTAPEPVADATDPDDAGVGERRPAVVDRSQGDAVHGVARQPAAARAEHRSPPLGVDREPEQGVGQRERLGAGRRARPRRRRAGRRCSARAWPRAVARRRPTLSDAAAVARGRMREHAARVLEVRAAHVHLDGDHARRGAPRGDGPPGRSPRPCAPRCSPRRWRRSPPGPAALRRARRRPRGPAGRRRSACRPAPGRREGSGCRATARSTATSRRRRRWRRGRSKAPSSAPCPAVPEAVITGREPDRSNAGREVHFAPERPAPHGAGSAKSLGARPAPGGAPGGCAPRGGGGPSRRCRRRRPGRRQRS